MADIAARKRERAFDNMVGLGWVLKVDSNAPLVEDYLARLRAGKEQLIVAPTHAEGDEITANLRRALKEEGKLGGLVLDNGWTVPVDFGRLTHGYVTTSHASHAWHGAIEVNKHREALDFARLVTLGRLECERIRRGEQQSNRGTRKRFMMVSSLEVGRQTLTARRPQTIRASFALRRDGVAEPLRRPGAVER